MKSNPVTNTQPGSSGLLDEAFDNVIKEAGTLPASEASASELPNLSGDTPGDRVKTIESMRASYKEHQQLIDEGILGAIKVLDSPQVKSLGTSIEEKLEVGKTDPETIKLADELAELDAFIPMKVTAAKTGVTTVGIGAALSLMKGLGLEAGAEATFQTQESNVSYRAWALLATGPDSSKSLGINLSIWFTRPVIGAISGVFVDLTLKAYPVSVRFSAICQRDDIGRGGWFNPKDFAALSIRIGAGRAVQVTSPKSRIPPGLPVVIGFAGYYGYQWAPVQKPGITKATLTVLDANGTSQIIIGAAPKDMYATLTAPSAPAYTLQPNASSMTIALPSWVNTDLITFSELTGWSTPQYDSAADNFVSSYVGASATWGTIEFVIKGVQANSALAQPGTVSVIMNIDPAKKMVSPTYAPLALVAGQGSISFNWNVLYPSSFTLASGQSASGENVVLYTNSNVLQKMSGIIDAQGTPWDLDVLYEFASDPINPTLPPVPMVQAIWQESEKPKLAKQYEGTPAYIRSSAEVKSIAYYNSCNDQGNSNCPQFQVTATPLDPPL